MTFCFFSAQYLPTVGGVERYTHALGARLSQKGHRVIVITSALHGLPERETQDGIELVRLPSWWLMNGRFPVCKPCTALRRARALVRQAAPALVVVQTRFYPLSLFGARTAKQLNLPALVVEHGTAHLLHGGMLGVLGNAYEHTMMRLVRRHCNRFYGVSKACAAWLAHFGIHTDKVLYNAVDPAQLAHHAMAAGTEFLQPYLGADAALSADQLFALAASAQDASCGCSAQSTPGSRQPAAPQSPSPTQNAAAPQIVQATPVIAFAGRFVPEKGILPLLAAFRTVREKHPRAVLLLAGDGPQLAEVRAQLPEGAHLLGMLPYTRSLALLARADIYCLPTLSEGFSTSVLEAAALRATIVTTATGGSPELVVDATHGILLPDMRAVSIAAALDAALSDPAWRAAAQENAVRRLVRYFTWDAVSNTLLALAVHADAPALPKRQ